MADRRYEEIGKRIKEAREERDVSQTELALEIGFSSATAVSLIESGDRKVDIETLETIAKVLHHEIDYFLDKETKKEAKSVDVKVALRAVKELSHGDREAVASFVDFLKKKKNG